MLLECPPKGRRRALIPDEGFVAFRCRHQAQFDQLSTVLEFYRLVTKKRCLPVSPQHLQIGAVLAGIRKMFATRNFELGAFVKIAQKLEMQQYRALLTVGAWVSV